MGRLTITQWAPEDRPREKMLQHGASALSNAELLGILIGSGNAEQSAVELMRTILEHYHNNLGQLGKTSIDELCTYKGIGEAKAVTIAAALELGRRRKEETPFEPNCMTCSTDIYDYFHPLMCDLAVEECYVLLLNNAHRVLRHVRISVGGLTLAAVDVRLVLREALLQNATAIALCHNHPSGNIRPSNEDIRLTTRLRQAAEVMNIHLIDHIILADGNYYSFADENKL